MSRCCIRKQSMGYVRGGHYDIELLDTPIAPMYHVADAEFVRSYEEEGNTSLVFRYSVARDDFVEWARCWSNVATNYTISDCLPEPVRVESHIYERRIKKTTPIRYALMPDENCGGGTLSYCQRTESDQWPKYVDDKGCKRCCICGCRGPMIDTALMHVLMGAHPAITTASD